MLFLSGGVIIILNYYFKNLYLIYPVYLPVNSDSIKASNRNSLTAWATTHNREFLFGWIAEVIKLLCHSTFWCVKYYFFVRTSYGNMTARPA